jgi:glycosyltransferase involved in cell wall biosynthesis
MKILWIGVLATNEAVKKVELISVAANNWQSQFVTGLNNNGASTICLSYVPSRYWPLGDFRPKFDVVDLPKNFKTYGVSYYNIPLLREVSLGWSLIRATRKHKIDFDLLITYNPFRRHFMIGKYAKKILKKKWALIIADGSFAKDPDFSVFLSHSSYLSHKLANKYFIPGGTGSFKYVNNKCTRDKIIVYTGSITKLTGIVEFALLFDKIGAKDIKFHIYGKGNSSILNDIVEKNENIVLHGFVDQTVLDNAMLNAWAFINPRNSIEEIKQNTFPSKLLEYIAYGKPIISTPVSSITSEFKDLLMFYNQDDILSLSKILREIESYSVDDLVVIQEKAKEFCHVNSWDAQTRGFLNSINI